MEKETLLQIQELQRQVFAQNDTINDLKQFLRSSECRVLELENLINSPEIDDFIKGFKIEAAHQTERWELKNEEQKTPHHYILVYNKLLGKLAVSVFDNDKDKFKHHLITLAASGFNCFRQIEKDTTMINEYFK